MACAGCERRRKAMEAKRKEIQETIKCKIERARLLYRLRRGKL